MASVSGCFDLPVWFRGRNHLIYLAFRFRPFCRLPLDCFLTVVFFRIGSCSNWGITCATSSRTSVCFQFQVLFGQLVLQLDNLLKFRRTATSRSPGRTRLQTLNACLQSLRPQPEEHGFFNPQTITRLTNGSLTRDCLQNHFHSPLGPSRSVQMMNQSRPHRFASCHPKDPPRSNSSKRPRWWLFQEDTRRFLRTAAFLHDDWLTCYCWFYLFGLR